MELLKSRPNYHHGNLEAALLATATEMVRQKGAEHLSLRAVSAQLGVSPSAAYHYFPDKDALITGLGYSLLDVLADMQEIAIMKISGRGVKAARARFRALGTAYFEWATKEPNLFRLLFSAFCEIDPATRDERRADNRAWNLLQGALDDLLATGAMRPEMRPYGEVLAWSSVHGASALIVAGHLPAEAFNLLMDGLERALGIGRKPHE